jgi:hypothetical protein
LLHVKQRVDDVIKLLWIKIGVESQQFRFNVFLLKVFAGSRANQRRQSGIRCQHRRGRAQSRKKGLAQFGHLHGGFLESERVVVGNYYIRPSAANLY